MKTLKEKVQVALSLALVLLMLATVGSAQAPKPSAQAGHVLSEQPDSTPTGVTNPPLISGQFDRTSVWWVSDPGGQNVNITINVPGVTPYSRVFASICESTHTPPYTCFQGLADPYLLNVIPQWGSVRLTFNPNWTAFTVYERFSLLIDP